MKTSKCAAAAVLSLLAVTGVQAEEYHGVQAPVSALSRTDVYQQAVRAAYAPNQNVPAAAIPMAPLENGRDRASVNMEAVAAANNPVQNLGRGAFVNSIIPPEYTTGSFAKNPGIAAGSR
ncbi:hypothetical protein SAMN05518845_115160 [Variovorax sp. YR750]|uniref:hypothetical protein n=1 Tax=Variovorax sp. YR750 TaxID=1884384 RepID=UPI0008BEDD59|nr:hypothetical protein [Variovorax sp. YR750]SEM06085.1 hypothetical protein SAMN05518845_115160 [Variovorax sp. YR750]